jgi:hypothetical protein
MVGNAGDPDSGIPTAPRTTDWQNFNVALSHHDTREHTFAGGRVVVEPHGATVVAARPVVVLNPRSWQTFEERFLQFFYRFPVAEPDAGESDRSIVLDRDQSWFFPFSESDPMMDEPDSPTTGSAAPGPTVAGEPEESDAATDGR